MNWDFSYIIQSECNKLLCKGLQCMLWLKEVPGGCSVPVASRFATRSADPRGLDFRGSIYCGDTPWLGGSTVDC